MILTLDFCLMNDQSNLLVQYLNIREYSNTIYSNMSAANYQINSLDRQELIRSYGFVEQLASNENFLKESLELAARICGTTKAYISLLDDEKQYILASHQTEIKTIEVQNAICQLAIKGDSILVIENTSENELTRSLPQVIREGGVKFYAGFPLLNKDNFKIGALCVIDDKTKTLSTNQKDMLGVLAKQVVSKLDSQRSLIQLIKQINTNFKPAQCVDLYCLEGELAHLQNEVIAQNEIIKKQKNALRIANEELVNFANMLAHDVRAPLNTIMSFINLHEQSLDDDSKSHNKEYLGYIKEAASNLKDLTSALLEYATSGLDSINAKIDLNNVLQIVKLNLTDSIKAVNAEIIFPEDTFFISGNKVKLIQLFQNLISNGLKYQDGKRRPQIVVKAKSIDNQIKISIIDNGIGIAPESLMTIFEPFKRLHKSSEFNGSGIGLATCKKIVQKLGSNFHVASEINKGSTFSFEMPKYNAY